MGRYIKFFDSIEEWEWVNDRSMFCFWTRILLMANWKDTIVKGIVVGRGSFLTSYRDLAKRLHYSLQEVRTCIDKLKKSGQILVSSAHLPTQFSTMITICNYDSYQGDFEKSNTVATQLSTQLPTQQTDYDTASFEEVQHSKQHSKQHNKGDSLPPVPPIPFNNLERDRNARAREDWRHLSSARLDYLRMNGQAVADFKRSLLLEEVKGIAGELGLSRTDVESFMQKWGESSPGSDMIRAEYEPTFNVRERAKNYVGVGRPETRGTSARDLIAEEMRKDRERHEKRNQLN